MSASTLLDGVTNVVFTGPATLPTGRPVLRADLVALANKNGLVVQSSVRASTQLLVAARFNTVKARAALDRGLRVTSYAAFIAALGGEVPSTGATPDVNVDAKSAVLAYEQKMMASLFPMATPVEFI
jgi:hypothetical protein